MRWDLFCRVIDNYGDIGVCWRLARELAGRGQTVRLWTDDASALAWMAPQGAVGVEVRHWHSCDAGVDPGTVVVEAFGCDPPPAFVGSMARAASAPLWINLEYLSAERYVERSHSLMSPVLAGPGAGLTKWFFFPGFSDRTGGLLREPDLAQRQRAFDAGAWCAARGLAVQTGERRVALFGYPDAPWAQLPAWLAAQPTLLVLTASMPELACRPGQRVLRLPWLSQDDFDHLLWSCDLNFVRGEDSLVRAIWSGRPFIWQLYPQQDGAHAAKLAAFAETFGAADVPELVPLWRAWNRLAPWPDDAAALLSEPAWSAWHRASAAFRQRLMTQADLATRLLDFVQARSARALRPA